jgi:hypothetical protein
MYTDATFFQAPPASKYMAAGFFHVPDTMRADPDVWDVVQEESASGRKFAIRNPRRTE